MSHDVVMGASSMAIVNQTISRMLRQPLDIRRKRLADVAKASCLPNSATTATAPKLPPHLLNKRRGKYVVLRR